MFGSSSRSVSIVTNVLSHSNRFFSSNKTSLPLKKNKFFNKRNAAVGIVILGTTMYMGDLIINDEVDSLWDWTRTRLPEEESKKRPNLVILGTGWGNISFKIVLL